MEKISKKENEINSEIKRFPHKKRKKDVIKRFAHKKWKKEVIKRFPHKKRNRAVAAKGYGIGNKKCFRCGMEL